MNKDDHQSYEGCIKVGPWGGPKGDVWSYKPHGPIKEIVIVHGGAIYYLRFKSVNAGVEEFSVQFGGKGGNRTDKIVIDNPLEYLTTISGTFGDYDWSGRVTSLCFFTNITKYGPFGSTSGHEFSFPVALVEVVGFHGRAGKYIDAIGIYISPKSSNSTIVPKLEYVAGKAVSCKLIEDMPREVIAWGSSGGKPWDDGVFSCVKEIRLWTRDFRSHTFVAGVQFIYASKNGKTVLSPKYGRMSAQMQIEMDCKTEFLVGISGYYGQIKHDGLYFDGITSLTFYTNKGKYGPIGGEVGTYFTSTSSAGRIVGFY